MVKAQLQDQQRTRELSDAKLAAEKSRLELGVLLFPDPRTAYILAEPDNPAPLALRAEVDQAAAKNNPELRSALAALYVATPMSSLPAARTCPPSDSTTPTASMRRNSPPRAPSR